MRDALSHTYDLVALGGTTVVIVGNNTVCGRVFDTQRYLTEISNELGLELLIKGRPIRSRGLITKRHSSAGVIAKETILVFKKGNSSDRFILASSRAIPDLSSEILSPCSSRLSISR